MNETQNEQKSLIDMVADLGGKAEATGTGDGTAIVPAEPQDQPVKEEIKQPEQTQQQDAFEEDYQKRNWKNLRDAARSAKKEADEWKAKFESAQTAVKSEDTEANRQRMSELEKQYNDALKILELKDLESHPKFRQEYVEPREQRVNRMKRILAENEIADADIESVLSMKGRDKRDALASIAESLSTIDSGAFAVLAREIDDLDDAKKAALEQSGNRLRAYRAEEISRNQQAIEEQRTGVHRIVDQVAADARDIVFLQPTKEQGPEADQWNARRAEIQENARKLLTEVNDYPSLARAALEAASYRHMQDLNYVLMKELEQLRARVSEQGATSPGLTPSSTPSPSANDGKSLLDLIKSGGI